MNLAITRANHDTLDALVPLFDAYRKFYGQAPDLQRVRAFLSQRMDADDSCILLAHSDSQALGFTQLYPLWSSVNMAKIWLLNDLFVKPEARRHGVASTLLNAAREHGRRTGAHSLMLETDPDNYPAQRLYQSHGWQRQSHFWFGLIL